MSSNISITQEIHKRSFRISARVSLVLFVVIGFALFLFQVQQQRTMIQQKLEIDAEFIVSALKVGDIFFVTKYLSAFVESGAVSACGIKAIGEDEWVKVIPSVGYSQNHGESGFQLNLLSTTIYGIWTLRDQAKPAWHIFYSYKVNHVFLLFAALISISFSIIIFFFLNKILRDTAQFFAEPVENLSKDLDAQMADAIGNLKTINYLKGQTFTETDRFVEELKSLVGEINLQKDKIKEAEVHEALSRLGQQVNHDIQSPIGALTAAVSQIDKNKELSIGLIKKSIYRIQEIVADLRIKDPNKIDEFLRKTPTPLSQFVANIVEEKRVEYFDKVDFTFSGLSEELLIDLDQSRIARAISNIINNGIEAVVDRKPKIDIALKHDFQKISIFISDNGPGIDEAIFSKVFDYGFTSGKKRSSGTGLTQAQSAIQVHKGRLRILPKTVNFPTTIIITFPFRCEGPL